MRTSSRGSWGTIRVAQRVGASRLSAGGLEEEYVEEEAADALDGQPGCLTSVRIVLSAHLLGTTYGQWFVLFSLGVLMVGLGTLAWRFVGGNDDYDTTYGDSFWVSWGLFVDPGTQTGVPAKDPKSVKFFAVFFSMLGFIFNLTVLGTVVDKVRGILTNFEEMHSRLTVSQHRLILGWGDKTLWLLNELLSEAKKEVVVPRGCSRCCWRSCCCCCSRRVRRKIVLLADKPVVEMKQIVRMHLRFEGFDDSHILYREGSPSDRTELVKVCAHAAEDILIMGTGTCAQDSDQQIIQTLLALGALPGSSSVKGDVWAEMQTHEAQHVVRTILPDRGYGDVEAIVARHAVNRILVLRAVVPSIGYFFIDSVSFRGGNEFYLVEVPESLRGKTLGSISNAFPDAVVCGVVKRRALEIASDEQGPKGSDSNRNLDERKKAKEQAVSMDWDYVLADHETVEEDGGQYDRLLLLGGGLQSAQISSDFEAVPATTPTSPDLRTTASPHDFMKELVRTDGQLLLGPTAEGPKNVLLFGCPPDFPSVLEALDSYLASGSAVHVLSPRDKEWRDGLMRKYFDPTDGREPLRRIKVTHHVGDPAVSADMNLIPLCTAHKVIILSDLDNADPVAADSRNLTTVITLKAKMDKLKVKHKVKVVTELLDPKSQQLLRKNNGVRKLSSFVYSNSLCTGLFAAAAADKVIFHALRDFLDPDSRTGTVVALRISGVVSCQEDLSFRDLSTRVRQRTGGVLLGWRRQDKRGDDNHIKRYPELNPENKEALVSWFAPPVSEGAHHLEDELVVLLPSRKDARRMEVTPKAENTLHETALKTDTEPFQVLLPGNLPPIA